MKRNLPPLAWIALAALACLPRVFAALPETDTVRLLPADTVAYLRFADFPQLRKDVEASGLADALLKHVPEEDRPQADALRDTLREATAVQLSMHERFSRTAQTPFGFLLAVAHPRPQEALGVWLEVFPAEALRVGGGVPIYRWADSAEPLPVYAGCSAHALLLASEPDWIAAAAAREEGLAHTGLHQSLAEGDLPEGSRLFVNGPKALDMLRFALHHEVDHFVFQAAHRIFALEEIEGVMLAGDYRGQTGVVRLSVLPEGAVSRILMSPPGPLRAPELVPADAALCVARAISGPEAVQAALEHAYRAVRTQDGVTPEDFLEGMERIERGMGVPWRELLSLSSEAGFFLWDGNPAVFFVLRDPAKAMEMGEALLAHGRARVVTDRGVRFWRFDGLSMHFADGNVLMAFGHPSALLAIVHEWREGRTLARSTHFAELREQLPRESVDFAYFDYSDAMLKGLLEGGFSLPEAPPLRLALASQTRPGMYEFRMAQTGGPEPADALKQLAQAVEEETMAFAARTRPPEWYEKSSIELIAVEPPYDEARFERGEIRDKLVPPPEAPSTPPAPRPVRYEIGGKVWTQPMTCASCGQRIPMMVPDLGASIREGATPQCPLCGNPALRGR